MITRRATLAALQLGRRRLGGVAATRFAPRHGKAVEPTAWRPVDDGKAAERREGEDGKVAERPEGEDKSGKTGGEGAVDAEVIKAAKISTGGKIVPAVGVLLSRGNIPPTMANTASAAASTANATPSLSTANTAPTSPSSPTTAKAAPTSPTTASTASLPQQETTTTLPLQETSIIPSQSSPTLQQSTTTSQPNTPPATTTTTTTESPQEQDQAPETPKGPVDAVLAGRTGPAMAPPPYVHHFDSYSLVKQLQDGGYSEAQATTAMKGIRTLLAQNLDVAQKSLVSKSDVENEAYLFSAACSELSAEIKNNRRLRDEQMRQQRTHLQHEVDILTQSLNQELLTLTDSVRGMFNDRKMAVREEQKTTDSAIQKIMYKMSILLSSDSRSDIEGVRWVLIRRSVLGIIFMAILTLCTLRYTSYVSQQRKEEAERARLEEEELRKAGGRKDRSAAADAAAILAAS